MCLTEHGQLFRMGVLVQREDEKDTGEGLIVERECKRRSMHVADGRRTTPPRQPHHRLGEVEPNCVDPRPIEEKTLGTGRRTDVKDVFRVDLLTDPYHPRVYRPQKEINKTGVEPDRSFLI